MKFPSHLKCDGKIVSEMGPRPEKWNHKFSLLPAFCAQSSVFLQMNAYYVTHRSLTRQSNTWDLLWEYRIQHGANGPLYVTSSYSTWIFCRGVSGFATDCPCGVWCRGLTTCLLHVGPPFGNRILNNSWAVSLTWWIMNLIFLCFDICNYIRRDTSGHFSV